MTIQSGWLKKPRPVCYDTDVIVTIVVSGVGAVVTVLVVIVTLMSDVVAKVREVGTLTVIIIHTYI